MPKVGQKLVFLVIEFLILIYVNVAFNYIILLGQEVFGKMVFNRLCKSI